MILLSHAKVVIYGPLGLMGRKLMVMTNPFAKLEVSNRGLAISLLMLCLLCFLVLFLAYSLLGRDFALDIRTLLSMDHSVQWEKD